MKINIKKPDFNKLKKGKKSRESSADATGVDFSAPADGASFGVQGEGVNFSVSHTGTYRAADFAAETDPDAFGVNVRNEETGIRLLDKKAEGPWWTRELPHEIATAFALMTFFALVLSAGSMNTTIPFLLPGVVIYIVLVVLGEKFEERIKYFTAIGIFALLVIMAIAMRKYVWGGIGSILNSVYDVSEAEQAYIYNRFDVNEVASEHPVLCIRLTAAWLSVLAGVIGAVPIAQIRRGLGLGVAIYAMISMAYYGIVPAAVILVIAAAVLLFLLSRGGMLAALPVLLISLLLFGAVVLINPGENYGISRMDENFRDRFALRSAYLESNISPEYQDEMNDPLDQEEQTDFENDGYAEDKKPVVPIIITLLVLAALGGGGYLLYSRYKRRRDEHRSGIDSEDPRTAIVAMFPYAVRWLGAADVDVFGKSFASIAEPLRRAVSDQYSNYYSSMYVLWREAAYSDHEMNEEKRAAMKEFLNDTTDMVKRDMKLPGKIKTALKYAL